MCLIPGADVSLSRVVLHLHPLNAWDTVDLVRNLHDGLYRLMVCEGKRPTAPHLLALAAIASMPIANIWH